MEDAAVPSDTMDLEPGHVAPTAMSAFKAAAKEIESALVAAEEHARENSAKEAAAADEAPTSKKKKPKPTKEKKAAHDADATQPRAGDADERPEPASLARQTAKPTRRMAADGHNASAVANQKQKSRVSKVSRPARLPRVTGPRACHVSRAHALATCHVPTRLPRVTCPRACHVSRAHALATCPR